MYTPRELQHLYEHGENITQLLRQERGLAHNTHEIIEIAYDLRTGSYVAAMKDPDMQKHKREYSSELTTTILSLYEPTSVLEAGVGEVTTLSGVLEHLDGNVSGYGFDLS